MSKQATATRADIDEVLDLMRQFMQQTSDEFQETNGAIAKNAQEIQRVLGYLDSMEKRMEINEDERVVMGHQLDRLHKWTTELAKKIGHSLSP